MIHYVFDLDDTIIMHHKHKPIPYNEIKEDKILEKQLTNFDQPCYIYTNGTGGHALAVLEKMKLVHLFDKVYSRDTIPYMKPDYRSFNAVHDDISLRYPGKHQVYFFDDLLENLKEANGVGWKTFWIHPNSSNGYPSFVNGGFHNIKECLEYLELNN
jgi:FMN phosphatase YigB (HAD superfamily)|tara:strand:- start:986 stop:1456 length:471 start_codon:yes stop_codon:yes gene_type:complete